MRRYLQICGVVMCLAGSPALWAQEAKPADVKPTDAKPAEVGVISGEIQIGEKTYKVGHVLAYETRIREDVRINVLMSDRAIPVNAVKEALKEDEGMDTSLSLRQPYLKLTFRQSGELLGYQLIAVGTGISGGDDNIEGKMTLENDRVKGEAKLPLEGEDALQRAFSVKYDVALGLDKAPKKVRPAGPVKPVVTGKFIGNGKAGKLAFVSCREGEAFADKPAVLLILTERDHTKDPKPDLNARFGKYGDALIISAHEDGSIFGCEIVHSGFQKGSFSSVGGSSIDEFDLGDGQISGRLVTDKEQEFFGDKWEFDLKFAAPYTPSKKPVVVAEKDPPANDPMPKKSRKFKKKSADEPKSEDEPKAEKSAEPTDERLSIYDLALPKDASDHQYKTLVEMFEFQSKLDSLSLVKELTKTLADQGWKADGSDLVTAKSSILKRKRGEAELTIFVKPAAKGSKVNMHTEGLDWKEKSDKKAEKKKADDDKEDADDKEEKGDE